MTTSVCSAVVASPRGDGRPRRRCRDRSRRGRARSGALRAGPGSACEPRGTARPRQPVPHDRDQRRRVDVPAGEDDRRRAEPPARPARSAASPTAPAPSTRSFVRSRQRTSASEISSSETSTVSSSVSSRIEEASSPRCLTAIPSAIVSPGLRDATPRSAASPAGARGARARSRRRGHRRRSGSAPCPRSAACSASSSPIVPWPAITRGSSKACTSVAPVRSTCACAAATAASKPRPDELDRAVVGAGRLHLRHRRVLGHEDRRGDPASRAAQATACPWLPGARRHDAGLALLGVSLGDRVVRAADLERAGPLEVLGLEQDGRPASRENVSEGVEGVSRATPASRARAASMSASVGLHRPSNTFSMISRTAVSGSSSRRCTDSSRRRSSGSSATAASSRDFAGSTPPRTPRPRGSADDVPRARRRARARPDAPRASPRARRRSPPQRLGEDDRRAPLLVGQPHDRAHLVQHRLRRRVIHLVDAITSGISMIPAFSACTESPEPGMSTRSTVSAIP